MILKLLEDAIARSEVGRQARAEPRQTIGGSMLWSSKARDNSQKRDSENSGDGEGDGKFDDLPTLEAVAQEWIDKLEQFGKIYPVAQPRALLLKGIFNVVQNSIARRRFAFVCFKRSQSVAHQLQMPYDEALALYELGKHADSSHHMRLKQLQSAHVCMPHPVP